MTFTVRHFLRQVPVPALRSYFSSKHVHVPSDWWKLKESKIATKLADYLISSPDPASESVLVGLVRLHPMSNDLGRTALLNAAGAESDVPQRFRQLSNDTERALWMLMTYPETFREAEELRFFDYYATGNRGRHYTTEPNLHVSREKLDIAAFERDICQCYRKLDGSGISCLIEFAERRKDKSLQLAIYVQGLPNNEAQFENRQFVRRVSHPALEAGIVYDLASGSTSTVAKGGKRVHEVLRESFARRLLKVEPRFDLIQRREFLLDALKTPSILPPDASLGVKAVRVRKLILTPGSTGAGILTIEAPTGRPEMSVYDLANSWFSEGARVFAKFVVVHATISMHFHPLPGATRAKTLNIELTRPNGSNLRNLPDTDRSIAEAHIENWKLIRPKD